MITKFQQKVHSFFNDIELSDKILHIFEILSLGEDDWFKGTRLAFSYGIFDKVLDFLFWYMRDLGYCSFATYLSKSGWKISDAQHTLFFTEEKLTGWDYSYDTIMLYCYLTSSVINGSCGDMHKFLKSAIPIELPLPIFLKELDTTGIEYKNTQLYEISNIEDLEYFHTIKGYLLFKKFPDSMRTIWVEYHKYFNERFIQTLPQNLTSISLNFSGDKGLRKTLDFTHLSNLEECICNIPNGWTSIPSFILPPSC